MGEGLLSQYREVYPLGRLNKLTETEAFNLLVSIRWSKKIKGKLTISCPKCGNKHLVDLVTERGQWVCKNKRCKLYFSPKSYTMFAGTRISYKQVVNLLLTYAGDEDDNFPCNQARKMEELKIGVKTISTAIILIRLFIGNDLSVRPYPIFGRSSKSETRQDLINPSKIKDSQKQRTDFLCLPKTAKDKSKREQLVKEVAKYICDGNCFTKKDEIKEKFPKNYRAAFLIFIRLNRLPSEKVRKLLS